MSRKGKSSRKEHQGAAPKRKARSNNAIRSSHRKGGFTLLEEAKNTEHNRHSILSTNHLIQRKVDFVSVGTSSYKPNNSPSNTYSTRDDFLQTLCPGSSARPASSDSGDTREEVVLFKGRGQARNVKEPTAESCMISTLGSSFPQVAFSGKESKGSNPAPEFNSSLVPDVKSAHKGWADKHCGAQISGPLDEVSSELEEDILADYVANMDPGDFVSSHRPSFDMSSPAPAPTPFRTNSNSLGLTPSANKSYTKATDHIIGPEDAQNVWDVGDSDALESEIAEELVGFGDSGMSSDDNSVDSEEQARKDLSHAFEKSMLDDLLLRRRQGRMTDEQIARRLAKQEELGIESSEVLLFDGQEEMQESSNNGELSEGELEQLRQMAQQYQFNPKSSKSTFQSLDASVSFRLSDQYDGFDVMDRDRESIQPRRGKGRAIKNSGLLDTDIEQSLVEAWEKDRSKKKARKQERESLRAQGLLDRKGGSDLRTKYPKGMGLHQVIDELRSFLQSDREYLVFVPLDKQSRKIVHEIASNFSVKSISRGEGDQRYPSLTKRARSRPFSEQAFSAIVHRISRRVLPRPGKKAPPRPPPKRNKGVAIATYRDGEVVGAGAPELSAENRGRTMLEKMGWSSGTPLGALNNKGLLQPISHVVKNTRTGLG